MTSSKVKFPKPRLPTPDFSARVVLKLGQRSAYRCSNPDCDALTIGPNPEDMKATIVGEGAHIYGARRGQARYREEMTDAARASISNGIWLCVMCHAVIDREERNYSPDLLFHWRNAHEAKITAERGKPKELIKLREQERQMNDFADVSLFAQQIIRDKPPGWEYQLTAEALDNLFTPILRRWKDLHAGSYTKDVPQQKPDQYLKWVGAQIPELPKISESLGDLINIRLKEAWGAEGVPGDPKEIVHVCRMIAARATRLLEWDEAMHFVTPAKGFGAVPKHLSKGVEVVMEKIPEISSFLRSIFHEGKVVPGTYKRTITFDLSDDFDTGLEDAMEAGRLAYEKRGRRWT